jgi:hypothetical protein
LRPEAFTLKRPTPASRRLRLFLSLTSTAVFAATTATATIAAEAGTAADAATPAAPHAAYENFAAAIYITVTSTRQLADAATLERQYARVSSQLRFDKVYLEVYRNGVFADDSSLERIKKFFAAHGVAVSGGVTLAAGGHGGQFGTFDYENPQDRAECQRAVEMAARHFNEVILDDFFFYTSKSDADIAAKGNRSWTEYRLQKMREVARNLVLGPARALNPHVRMIIKYPNWYEHFQGLGYDLDQEAREFDAIYTGTETRDPEITDQLLQQYESYLIVRYFDNIRPNGGNRGGWVDTFGTGYVDRYAEQLWDTLWAKAPEITLFNWAPLADPAPVAAGDRSPWQGLHTSFDWDEMTRSMQGRKSEGGAGWARVAGYSLEQADRVLGLLGNPIGIASYKPYQSSGEDFLQEYLGNIGIPIELTPHFPVAADLMLLTEAAKYDPDIIPRIKSQLTAGKSVVITSGLLHALQDRGIQDIAEWQYTGRQIAVQDFFEGYGAGNGTRLPGGARDILFPEIHFYTNDSWALLRGVASLHGIPILLMNRYSRGVLYVLDIPDNIGDLYRLPQPALSVIRTYLQGKFPVRLEAPPQVSLFAYDNGAFVVESFRPEPTRVGISVVGTHHQLKDLLSNEDAHPGGDSKVELPARTDAQRRDPDSGERTSFSVQIPPHSYRVFRAD